MVSGKKTVQTAAKFKRKIQNKRVKIKWQDSRQSDNVEDRRQNSVNSMGSLGALYRLSDFC